LEPALADIQRYGIKVAVNAGASDTKALADRVLRIIEGKGLKLKVSYITGDDVFPEVQKHLDNKSSIFENIDTGEKLADWKFKPIAAQAYLGGLGIAKALALGADIVLCGRVSDASPVIGASYWWHNWARTDLNKLANAFVAGHLIECSSYVTGGNFSGFKQMSRQSWSDIGYPIAEISADGQVVITKQRGTGGLVTVDTCKSQLLYEIQGPWYFNSDVTALLADISFEQLANDRVAMHGVNALPPPPTTKVGITAPGGFHSEFHYALVGLDIKEKAQILEDQIRHVLGPQRIKKLSVLEFTTNGIAATDSPSQTASTVDFRVVAQALHEEDVGVMNFLRPCFDIIMQGYPGATPHMDIRTAMPRPIWEYYVTLLPQSSIKHKLVYEDTTRGSGMAINLTIKPPAETMVFPSQQPSTDLTGDGGRNLADFGPTTRGPLGWLVHARSGDKGSNANVGLWVTSLEQFHWLRSLLSTAKIIELLGEEYKTGKKIDRFELPGLFAVHFLLHEHLDRGVSCTKSYDALGKNVAEFLRSRFVDLPSKFLEARGKI
jgi:Acyclic terpene utilisation family protein AtuA